MKKQKRFFAAKKQCYLSSISLVMVLMLVFSCLLCGCGTEKKNSNLDSSQVVNLRIVGSIQNFSAIETVIQGFNKIYPNCNIEYEYIQDYKNNLLTRFENDSTSVDIFFTDNIQSDSPYLDYAFDLNSCPDKLDLSETLPSFLTNYTYMKTEQLFSVPFGGEVRGMFVNVSLLNKFGIAIPSNRTELLDACKTLSENGYIPMQGNPGSFAQQLMFPYVTNLVATDANHDETYQKINACAEGSSEYFRDPMKFVYTLIENNYYNYKYVEEEMGSFKTNSNENNINTFLNIKANSEGDLQKVDDLGSVPFMPGTIAQSYLMQETKNNYHSEIEYKFILAPVSDSGSYAYLSPSRGLAINKNSLNIDWSLEFLNFFFQKKNNTAFAESNKTIPNTTDSIKYVSKMFNLSESQITEPSDIAFDYTFFYSVINKGLVEVSKGNNPKYMNKDEDGNPVLYDFEHYMEFLEAKFAEQRASGEAK